MPVAPHSPEPARSVSRTAVLRGLAWTAPAVAAVAAAPFAAASPARFTVDFSAGRAVTSVPGGPSVIVTVGSNGTLTRSASSLTLTGAQTVTITFSQSVRDLSFTVSGLDRVDNNGARGLLERVSVTPPPGVVSSSGVAGAGTPGSPLQALTQGTSGSALLTVPGSTTSVTIVLSNGQGSATPVVAISGMTFLAEVR